MKKYLALALAVALAATVGGLLILNSAQGSSAAATEKPAAVDADNIEHEFEGVELGDQTSPDETSAKEAQESTEAESEAEGTESAVESAAEPAGENEPAGGGHEDVGENVEHEFEGVE